MICIKFPKLLSVTDFPNVFTFAHPAVLAILLKDRSALNAFDVDAEQREWDLNVSVWIPGIIHKPDPDPDPDPEKTGP